MCRVLGTLFSIFNSPPPPPKKKKILFFLNSVFFLPKKKRKEREKQKSCGCPNGHNFGHPLDRKQTFLRVASNMYQYYHETQYSKMDTVASFMSN